MNLRYLFPLLIAILMAVLFAVMFTDRIADKNDATVDGARKSVLTGKPMPQFTAPLLKDVLLVNAQTNKPQLTLADQSIILNSAKQNKVVLVNFWGSWCRECFIEHDHLMQLSQKLPIYGINFSDEATNAAIFLQNNGNPFTDVYFDADSEVYIEWGVTGAPETFVIDTNGRIQYRHAGPLNDEVVNQVILPLVEKLKLNNGNSSTPITTDSSNISYSSVSQRAN